MTIYTIGFTKKTAREFFGLLSSAGVRKLVDVRLNNVSQLAGFTKRADLEYFTEQIVEIPYEHRPELAPTKEILDAYKKNGGSWADYEIAFLRLMRDRSAEQNIQPASLDRACLLCSEAEPEHCHRRLVAEFLRDEWGDVEIQHL